jgi:hypothetical protein
MAIRDQVRSWWDADASAYDGSRDLIVGEA